MKQERKVFTEHYMATISAKGWNMNAQRMKFFMKIFFSKCDQIHRKLRITNYEFSEEIFNGKLYILYRVSLKSINCGENEQTKTQTCRWNYNYYQCQRANFY